MEKNQDFDDNQWQNRKKVKFSWRWESLVLTKRFEEFDPSYWSIYKKNISLNESCYVMRFSLPSYLMSNLMLIINYVLMFTIIIRLTDDMRLERDFFYLDLFFNGRFIYKSSFFVMGLLMELEKKELSRNREKNY